LSSFELLGLLGVGIVAHLGLILGARRMNMLFLIAGAFVILSLLSVSVGFSMFTAAKYGRVYATLLMVTCGVAFYRIHGLDRTTRTFSIFILYSLLSPLWSVVPLTGLAYKGLFLLAFFAGVFLAYSVREWKEAQKGFRYLVLLSAAGSAYAVVFYAPPVEIATTLITTRLQFLDLNPGRIGATASTMLLVCGFVGLYDRSKNWRMLGWATCALLAVLIVLSGNRSGALVAFVGTCVTAFPLLQRPRKLIPALFALVVLVGIGFLFLRDTFGMQRMFTLVNTRTTQWHSDANIISQAPLFGHGWVYVGRDAGYANLHSMYFQVTAEIGFVGLALFLGCSVTVLLHWYMVYRRLGRIPLGSEFVMLPMTFVVGVLVLGIFETAGMAGTSADGLFWGFGVGLVDRLPALLQQEARSLKLRARYGRRPVPGVE